MDIPKSCEDCYYYEYYGFCSLFDIEVEPKLINDCDEISVNGEVQEIKGE